MIVGVEAARTALEEFFEENSIKYIVSDLPDGAGSLFTVSLLIHPLPSLHFSEQQEYISFSVVNLLKFSVCTAAVNAYLIDIKIFSLHIICCLRWQIFIWPTIYVWFCHCIFYIFFFFCRVRITEFTCTVVTFFQSRGKQYLKPWLINQISNFSP